MASLVDRWVESTGECIQVDANGTGLESDCCPGGTIQPNDFKTDGLMAIPWLLILCWIFLGVMMGADVFMEAIEVITSAEVTKKVVTRSGKTKYFHVRRWNETVANLTLMALGSSAPEILLNVMEIFTNNYHLGALGPSTIVGSAAFNLFCIFAVCVASIPDGEYRTIKCVSVFQVTAAFSVMAYMWLLFIVKWNTEDIVDVWEALATCGWMIVLLVCAYRMDVNSKKVRFKVNLNGTNFRSNTQGNLLLDVKDNEKNKEVWEAVRDAGLLPPGSSSGEFSVEELAETLRELAPTRGKAYYRHHFLETVPGAGNALVVNQRQLSACQPKIDPLSGIAIENAPGSAAIQAQKQMQALQEQGSSPVSVATMPTASMPPRPRDISGAVPPMAPAAGVLRFVKESVKVMESDGTAIVKVERIGGTEGKVTVQYATKDQQARNGKDYEAVSGELTFEPGQTGPFEIKINVIDDDDFEKDETFTVVLSDVSGGATFDSETDGGASSAICTVTIANDDERATRFAKAMALLKLDLDELDLGKASWAEQLRDACSCPSKHPLSVLLTVLVAPWKLMFALVPPPQLWGGWPCFIFALVFIGFQVMLISDFANQMGCFMGLTPVTTAITFVALGTSLPDLFASRTAAVQERTADSSLGNVTGSNSVNVFGGLGLPWLIASVYWAFAGTTEDWKAKYPDLIARGITSGFVVRSGDLTFSVIIFTAFSTITIFTVLFRRPFELGGNPRGKWLTAAMFVSMWIVYVLLSALVSVGTITVNI
mmetsp:Transcript_2764/g.7692  ORF Transcript_2764/g.7692 Transcript_2764/m.7692 type:complete len:768 (+) Transcript_2764:90-2393(+)